MSGFKIEWLEIEGMDSAQLAKAPWLGLVAYDHSTGLVLVSAALSQAPEDDVRLCVKYDSTPLIERDGHAFVPLLWLMDEYPKSRMVCEVIQNNVQAWLQSTNLEGK